MPTLPTNCPNRHPPISTYCGLTIVLSNPSRFDLQYKKLLDSTAGWFFEHEVIKPVGIIRYECDIRTVDCSDPILPDTKCLLLLGETAFHHYTAGEYKNYRLSEQRGYPLRKFNGVIPCIASFSPQDCIDIKDYETLHNPLLSNTISKDNGREDEEEEGDEKQRHGITKRANYRFWLIKDVERVRQIIDNNGAYPSSSIAVRYKIYPSSSEVVNALTTHKNALLLLDIETDSLRQITVFGFAFMEADTKELCVYVVPIIRYDYTPAYSRLAPIFRALSLAMCRNTVVCHNGFIFDLFLLTKKYHLLIGPNHYDTLLAQHRMWPEAEKSLGHSMSMHCWEVYHKDEGVFEPKNHDQEQRLWQYNGKDVYGMALLYAAQQNYCKDKPNLLASIHRANSMIRPYLINTLLGIKVNEELRAAMLAENDRYLTQLYTRVIPYLAGEQLLPTSYKQMPKFFYGKLGYKIAGRSKNTGNPSLDENSLLKLKQAYPNNALIDVCLAYRGKVKESGVLKFTPLPEFI